MDFAEKQRIESYLRGTLPRASKGHINIVEMLRALEDVLNSDPQGDVRALLSGRKNRQLQFTLRRLNPVFTIDSSIISLEWNFPLRPQENGLFEAKINEGRIRDFMSFVDNSRDDLWYKEHIELLSLDYHAFEIMYAAHEMLSELGRKRLGNAIPEMLASSSMRRPYKFFFKLLAAEYFPPSPEIAPIVSATHNQPEIALN